MQICHFSDSFRRKEESTRENCGWRENRRSAKIWTPGEIEDVAEKLQKAHVANDTKPIWRSRLRLRYPPKTQEVATMKETGAKHIPTADRNDDEAGRTDRRMLQQTAIRATPRIGNIHDIEWRKAEMIITPSLNKNAIAPATTVTRKWGNRDIRRNY